MSVGKILGVYKSGNVVDKTIMATKRVIYRNRQKGKTFSIREIKALLKSQMQCEEYQSVIDNAYDCFQETWECIYNVL